MKVAMVDLWRGAVAVDSEGDGRRPPIRPLTILVGTVALLETLLLSALVAAAAAVRGGSRPRKAEVGHPERRVSVRDVRRRAARRVPGGPDRAARRPSASAWCCWRGSTLALGLLDAYPGLVVARFVAGRGRRRHRVAARHRLADGRDATGAAGPRARRRDRHLDLRRNLRAGARRASRPPTARPRSSRSRSSCSARWCCSARLRSPPIRHACGLRAPARRADATDGVLLGLWFVIIPGALFGMLGTLLPLQLDRLGVGAGRASRRCSSSPPRSARSVTTLTGRIVDRRGRIAAAARSRSCCRRWRR